MAKTKVQKADLMNQYKEALEKSKAVYVSTIQLDVNATTALKKELGNSDAAYSIVKNTLFRKALKDVKGIELMVDGQSSVIFCFDDIVAPAKKINDLQKEEKATPKIVIMGSTVVDASKIKELATLPSYEELVGKLLYVFNSGAQGFAVALQSTNKKLLWALNAIAESKTA